LFYHLRLRCYVVVELKAGAFKPEHAGKLSFYLSATGRGVGTRGLGVTGMRGRKGSALVERFGFRVAMARW